ncbi:hypothetical protein PSEUDO8Z_140140 [Pseudomonas sp. 8Z]|nr:hypothetical protein PSEUDO8Z_140140 [Pseudomonas sp. 8Z]
MSARIKCVGVVHCPILWGGNAIENKKPALSDCVKTSAQSDVRVAMRKVQKLPDLACSDLTRERQV